MTATDGASRRGAGTEGRSSRADVTTRRRAECNDASQIASQSSLKGLQALHARLGYKELWMVISESSLEFLCL
ncbi:hypothetical protein J6590_030441 [Homalodisca vitripennis]|nr:hypothetical protein J6590_030441 [Homalodisca vitripennis]